MKSKKMTVRQKQNALARAYGRVATGICGCPMKCVFINEEDGAAGYTDGKSHTVHVMWDGPTFEGATEEQKDMLRLGILVHECMHIVQTDFDYTNRVTKKMSREEAGVFMQFANTLEDPAIEYHSPDYVGGQPQKALRFSIKWFYDKAPGLGEEPYAFAQLINALIEFGDMGIIKGEWTFPEAREFFGKICALYDEGITRADRHERIDISLKCMEICRPLWEEAAKTEEEMKKAIEEALEELSKLLDSKEKEAKNRKSREEEKKSSSSDKDSKVEEKRKELINKMSKSSEGEGGDGEDAKNQDDGKSGSGSGSKKDKKSDKDGEGSDSDGEQNEKSSSKKSGKETGSGEESDENGEKSAGSGKKSGKKTGADGSEASDGDADGNSSGKSAKGETGENGADGKDGKNLSELGEPGGKAPHNEDAAEGISEADEEELAAWIEKQIDRALSDEKKEAAKESHKETELFDPSSITGKYVAERPYNGKVEVKPGYAEKYAELKAQYNTEIRVLSKQLKALLEEQMEEKVYGQSGKYNILRGACGFSADIFEKKKDPGENGDIAVMICVDESGSMHNDTDQARHAAIVVAEALKTNRIPFYIMGYSADMGGYDAYHEHFVTYDAYHEHFVTWSDTPAEMSSLVEIKALANNFDGYAFRTAAAILKKRHESRKAMFIITDGEPACSKYGWSDGIEDTKLAVADIAHQMSVYAIQIADRADPETMKAMYGRNFYQVDSDKITSSLGKKIVKVVKG